MPLDLYYYPISMPVRAVLLLAKSIKVKLNLKHLDMMKGEHLTPAFVEINPQHVLPTLVDDDFVIWESRAILAYIVKKYAKTDALHPQDPKKRAVINQRLYFDMNTLGQRMNEYFGPILKSGAQPDPEKFKRVEEALSFLNTFLDGQSYVAGNQKSIADFSIVVTVSQLECVGFDISKYPNIVSWFTNFKEELVDYEELNGTPAKLLGEYLANKIAKK